jgi:CheY-like chemotaxis protein
MAPLMKQAGYAVTIVENPQQALALYAAGARFDLILADAGDAETARRLTAALGAATEWHATPVMGLDLAADLASAPQRSAA